MGVRLAYVHIDKDEDFEFPNHREFGYKSLYGSLYSLISDASFSYSGSLGKGVMGSGLAISVSIAGKLFSKLRHAHQYLLTRTHFYLKI